MPKTTEARSGKIALILAAVGVSAWVVLAVAGADADGAASYLARIAVFLSTALGAIMAVFSFGFDKNTRPATIAAVIILAVWLLPFLKSIWMAVADKLR